MSRGRLAFVLALGVVAVALIPSSAAMAADKDPAGNQPRGERTLGLDLDLSTRAERVPLRRGAFCSVACLNRRLNRLTRAHNALVADHLELVGLITNCFGSRAVTQYSGYDYQGVVGATTALDFTQPGDAASALLLAFTCTA
jgi:hypothetical protein